MRIAIMGSGAVGGYFGARLAAAGQEVHFIARGAQLKGLQQNGLTIKSANGNLHLPSVRATDDPRTIGPVDFVLFTVKQFDTQTAAAMCKPIVGPDATVITLQNGMDAKERLRTILGGERVMPGAAYIASAAVIAPGVVSHAGPMAKLVFGEVDGAQSMRGRRFLAACQAAEITAELTSRIIPDLWSKFIFLAAFSGVSAITRKPVGLIRGDPATRQLLRDSVEEAAAVGKARGVALDKDCVAKTMDLCDAAPEETKASMLIDLERGNRLEVEWLSGAVARMGQDSGARARTHEVIYAALKLSATGAETTSSS